MRVHRDTDGQFWAEDKVKASGYCAIRIVLADDGPLGPFTGGVRAILDKFAALALGPGPGHPVPVPAAFAGRPGEAEPRNAPAGSPP